MTTTRAKTSKAGCQTIIWGPQIDDLEGVLDVIAQAGFQGVEFAQRPEMLRRLGDPRELRIEDLLRLLEERDLACLSLVGGTLSERVEFFGDARPEYLYVEDWDPQAAPKALDHGFTLALHPHVFKPIHRLADAIDLLDVHTELKFLLDTAHLTIAGDDPVEAIQRIAKDRLTGVHLKDWTPEYGRSSHRYAQGFTEPGEGIVPLRELLSELEGTGFTGWLVVEQDSTRQGPQASIFKSAQWLAEQRVLRTQPRKVPRIVARSCSPRPDKKRCDPAAEVSFVRALVDASRQPMERCYEKIVTAFAELIPCHLVVLWACNPANDFLSLLAITPDVLLPAYVHRYGKALTALAGERLAVTSFDLTAPHQWVDRELYCWKLVDELGLTRMVSIPVVNPGNHNHMPLLLDLFPRDDQLSVTDDELFWFGVDVGHAVDTAIDGLCYLAARRASILAGQSSTVKELLKGIRELTCQLLHCEEMSIFLANDLGDRLELAETTGVAWEVPRSEQFYRRGEGLTGRVWERNEPLLTTDALHHPHRKGKSKESAISHHDSCMIAPLVDSRGDVIAVVRCQNKRAEHLRAFNMFTDDDVALLDAISQAAVPYLQVRQAEERHRKAIGRVTHELKTPIVAIRGATQLMQAEFKRQGTSDVEFFGYEYLGDVWSWSEITQRLLGNADFLRSSEDGVEVHVERTLLLRDVVAPAVRQVTPLLRERGFSPSKIQRGQFREVPPLWVDKNLFQQILFNLLSNAVKYAYEDPQAFQVEIDGSERVGRYVICFRDWGLGIEEGIRERVFEEGFRAPEAASRNVSGQGLGLWVVRRAVEGHGGEIEVSTCSLPTELSIYLPKALRFYRPAPKPQKA